MTTHNQFPLLPGSRKCSSVLRTGRKPQKQMKEGGLLLCCCDHWSQWVGQEGRHRETEGEAARSKILGTSGQDLDRHGAEVEWPEGKSLVWSRSLARQRVKGWSRDGHLIWIGSSQPNVSAGSQHAWEREKEHTFT